MDVTSLATIWALFISAFTSATLLPGTSELALGLAIHNEAAPSGLLVMAATVGNVLGGATTFFLGWMVHSASPRLAEVRAAQGQSGEWLYRFGPMSLVMSWLPVVGDGLVLAAGALRYSPIECLLWITVGKFARYAVLAFMVS